VGFAGAPQCGGWQAKTGAIFNNAVNGNQLRAAIMWFAAQTLPHAGSAPLVPLPLALEGASIQALNWVGALPGLLGFGGSGNASRSGDN